MEKDWLDKRIYEQAVDLWGVNSQIDMVIEEMGELIVALSHYRRGRADKGKVAEEIADVQFMLEEMAYIFGHEGIKKWREIKELRVRELIKEELTIGEEAWTKSDAGIPINTGIGGKLL